MLNAAFPMIRQASRNSAEVLLAMLETLETIARRSRRPETRSDLLCHVKLVEAECQAGGAIEWDKQRIFRRCAELAAGLQK